MKPGPEAMDPELAALRKINRVLMDRVENAVNSTGNDYAIFERNILLQKRVEQRTLELEQRNRQLAALLAEQKHIGEELRESEQKHRLLFESAGDAIFIHDEAGKILAVNPMACKQLGYSHAELLSLSLGEVDAPDQAPHVPERIARLKEQGQVTFESLHRRKDGSLVLTEVSARWITWDRQPAIISICRDITERKRAEEKFRKVFDNAHDAILIHDAQGHILEVNPRMLEMYRVTHAQALSMSIGDISSPDMPEGLAQALWLRVLAGESVQFEWKAMRPRDKSLFDVEGNLKTISIDGEIRILGNIRDVTERKQAEVVLRAKTEELDRYFTSALDLLCIADTQGHFIRVNKEWERVLGYSVKDLEKRTFLEFVHPDDMAATLDVMSKLSDQEVILNFTNRYRCKDGSYRYIEWRSTPHGDLIYATARDVTERRNAEESLRHAKEAAEESETRFKALHNASFGGIIIHDKGLILDCNRGLSEITGYALDELIGMNGLLLISEKSRDRVMGHIVAQYEKPYDAIGLRKNGEEYPLRLEGRKIPYRGKEVRVVEFRDITAQKNLEAELSKAQILLHAAVEQSPVPMVLATFPDGKVQIINRATEEFLQIKAAEYLGKTLSEIKVTWQEYSVAGIPVPVAELPLPRALNGLTTRNMEMRIDVADGRQQWQMASGAPIYNDAGELIAGLLIMQDITEQKQAEAALRSSENRFKTMVDNSGDIIQIMDIVGKVSFVSGQVESILGYTEAEILAMDSTLAGIHPDDLPNVVSTLQASIPIPDAKGRAEYRYRHKDGRWIWLEATGTNLLHNPKVGGLFLIIQDISSRKQAEAALRESEEKLSALFASMTEMVVLHELVLDDAGQPINYRITDCNRAFTEVTGIAREAAVGKLATEVYGVSEPPYLQEFCQVGITGETYHFETFFAPMEKHFSISVVSPGKNRFATVTNDISDIKKSQHLIAAKNKELEQLVYVASHDLRSPLVNVDGYGRELEYATGEIILALECEDLSVGQLEARLRAQLPDITGALRHIRNSTRQMDGLLKGLLKLSRLGRTALDIRPLDMNELLARVVSTFQYQIREVGAALRVGNLPPCRGDDVQVVQIFANLIGNALKFRDPVRPCAIAVSGVVEPGRCVYCVEDNGLGIAPEAQGKIFELFHRLDPAKTEGEGLGLTIVRQILGRLHGEIWLESTPGVGSRFIVSLPKESASQTGNTETLL